MLFYFKSGNQNRHLNSNFAIYTYTFAICTQTEREREREQNTKYAIGCRSDPFAALRRDAVYEAEASADAAGGASSDGSNPYVESTDGAPDEELAQANAELEAQPLHHLDCLIQRHARERQQLARRVDELDAKYSKVRAHCAF